MKNILVSASILAFATFATGAAAQEKVRVLTALPGLCDSTVDELRKWAAVTNENAAYAVPSNPNATKADCGALSQVQVRAGLAEKAPSREDAIKAALQACESANVDAKLGKCVVIGTARTR